MDILPSLPDTINATSVDITSLFILLLWWFEPGNKLKYL